MKLFDSLFVLFFEEKMKTKIFILCAIAGLFLTACSPKADIFIQPSGDAIITMDIKSSPIMNTVFKSVSQLSDEDMSKSIFNKDSIKMELEQKKIQVLKMETNSIADITAKLKIWKDNNTNPAFFNVDNKAGKISLNIGTQNIKEFAGLLSEDDREYIDLLMAPALSGETMSKEEYETLIEAVYGNKLASELKKAKFKIEVSCPKKVQRINITPIGMGKKNGNKAYLEIPVSDILCLQDSIFIEITYTP